MPVYSYKNKIPNIDPSAYIAPSGIVIGDVKIGGKSSVWFNTVIRADDDTMVIGEETNIQDLCVLHVDPGKPLHIGDRVTVGHRCVIHGCHIDNECLVGMGSVIMNGAQIGRGCIIAAGSVILENTEIPPYSLVTGVPGQVKKNLGEQVVGRLVVPAKVYVARAKSYQSDNGLVLLR